MHTTSCVYRELDLETFRLLVEEGQAPRRQFDRDSGPMRGLTETDRALRCRLRVQMSDNAGPSQKLYKDAARPQEK